MPLARIEALDVHQGPLQRAFGVFAVDVQTGAGGKGGEISLPALTPDAVQALREARPHAAVAEDRAGGPRRQLSAGARRGGDGRAALDRCRSWPARRSSRRSCSTPRAARRR